MDKKFLTELEKELIAENKDLKQKKDKYYQMTLDYEIQISDLVTENERLKEEIKPFQDDYFKGLDNEVIAELAKKSIRITAENRKLESALREIREIADYDYYSLPTNNLCKECAIEHLIKIKAKINEALKIEKENTDNEL